MITKCRNCRVNIEFQPGDSDIQHECEGSTAMVTEDVPITNTVTDWKGNTTTTDSPNLQGMGHTLYGTSANIESGARSHPVTANGNRKATHITRSKIASQKTPDWREQ